MRPHLLAILLCFLCLPVARSQDFIYSKPVTRICYAGDKVTKRYVPPPKEFLYKTGAKGGGKINVVYSGFTREARGAMEYAVAILESVLPPDLDMTVKASWRKVSSSGVLGHASITAFARGWGIGAYIPEAYYPVAVAEKIAGRKLKEPYEADVELILNSSVSWYYGTDGKTPATKYDLVTAIIHELCHGLGFFDSMNVDNNMGWYGLGSLPVIYDMFVENQDGRRLTDTMWFAQNSKELSGELVGGKLYFNGPLTRSALGGSRAKLYSPPVWDPGSSVSHLDELETSAENALMTPFIDKGEAIHDPGKLTLAILGDLGWINTRIIPRKIMDTEDHLTGIDIAVQIKSDTTYNRDNVGLVYSFDGFNTFDTLNMIPYRLTNSFSRTVDIPYYNARLVYYFYAVDSFSRIFRSPAAGKENPYSVFIGTDTVKPVITHEKTDYFFEKTDSIPFTAVVTDNIGIDTVYIEYRINGGTTFYSGLKARPDDKYSNTLGFPHGFLKGGDSLSYRLVAIDKAAGRNSTILPQAGFFNISIEALAPAVRNYSTDFSDASDSFFSSGFEITTPLNFSSPGLHSEHPYKSPDEDNGSLDFSSVLRHPVIFDSAGMIITFRELVLVEPGEEGSVFGFSDFYDYVVVEGSKDYGRSWFTLADGYDSRINSSWLNAYNSSTDGNNSTFVGEESMMMERKIYTKTNQRITGGDSVLIRFRLHADPYARGWGWAIDDLSIGPLPVDEEKPEKSEEFRVYPNPGSGQFTLTTDSRIKMDYPYEVKIFNIAGRIVFSTRVYEEGPIQLNLPDKIPGLYFIVISSNSVHKTIKYSLIR
ncbi:MAG TPA: T9SS type A sorting domain-containing protein [Bacteroidales bacterium]|jgi:hypothetical protein|nr:T9SS type A sorting domain-containing protein [Bacteroidales bacterium]